MHIRLITILLLLAFPGPALTIIPDPEGERRQTAWAEYATNTCQRLQGVKDKASADAAARAIIAAKKKFENKYKSGTIGLYGREKAELESWEEKLRKEYFFGSEALAAALDAPAEEALIPSPVPAGLIAGMEAAARQKTGRDESISQGCGFTRETAWVVDIEDTRRSFMVASALAFDTVGPVYSASHREELGDSTRYMVFTLTLLREGKKYIVEQWCDITATGKVYPPHKRERARQEIAARAKEAYDLLLSIWDEETADDFGGDLLDISEDIHDLSRICESDKTLWGHLFEQLSLPERERCASHVNTLENSDGFGDEDLQEFLSHLIPDTPPH